MRSLVNMYFLVAEPFDSATPLLAGAINVTLAIILAMNTVTFFIYGLDKHLAKTDQYRVSEKALLWLCALFGAIGGFFGMLTFRHKTKKIKFKLTVPLLAILQTVLAVWMCLLL